MRGKALLVVGLIPLAGCVVSPYPDYYYGPAPDGYDVYPYTSPPPRFERRDDDRREWREERRDGGERGWRRGEEDD